MLWYCIRRFIRLFNLHHYCTIFILSKKKSKTIRVEWIDVQSPTGNFVVGPDHTALVSLLKYRGTLTYKEFQGAEQAIDTYGGIFKVDENKAMVFLDMVKLKK